MKYPTASIVALTAAVAACSTISPPSSRQSDRTTMIPPTADASSRAEPWLQDRDADRTESDAPSDAGPAIEAARAASDRGFEEAADNAVGWWPPLPDEPGWTTVLDDDRTIPGSLSLGTVSEGRLEDATRLPLDGPHYSVIERHRRRNTNWGTDEIVELLHHAAADVAERFPDSTLRIGNIGYKHGGNIPWSVSHNSGRDVDLAFFAQKASDGSRVPSPDLVSYRADGRADDHPELVFDAERNWALVRSLLTHSDTDILWILISQPLKEKILEHARQVGAPDKLVERASEVLHQPTSAPPHADHFHVRIACSAQDRIEGCVDWGPRWPWVDFHERELLARSLTLAAALEAGNRSQRSRALEFLDAIHSPYAPEVTARHALRETDSKLRRRALEIAADIPAWTPVALDAVRRLLEEHKLEGDAQKYVYKILRKSQHRMSRRIALDRLFDRDLPAGERASAARALLHTMEPGLVPVLIDELERQPAQVRPALAKVLRRITLYSTDVDWESGRESAVESGITTWRKWWERHRDTSRKFWIKKALSRTGVDQIDLEALDSIDRLIPLLRQAPDFIAYNVNRHIHRLTERWAPLEAWTYRRLHSYWSSWWKSNRKRLLADDEPAEGPTAQN